MANLLEGLFGLRPNLESQQEQMQTERGMGFGELLGRAGVNPYAPKAVQDAYLGRQAAQGALVGKAANTVAGLFGMETPELQRAKGMESILQQTQADTDLNNPAEFYPTLAKRMAEAGFTQEAIQIGQVGAKAIQDFNLSSSTISKNTTQAQKAQQDSILDIAKFRESQLTAVEKEYRSKEVVKKQVADGLLSPEDGQTQLASIDAGIKNMTTGALASVKQRIVSLSDLKANGSITDKQMLQLDELIDMEAALKAAGSSKVSVTNDMGTNESLLYKEVYVPQAKDAYKSATSARTFAHRAKTIARLLSGKGGGAVLSMTTDIARTLGIQGDTIKANDLANSIATVGATMIRAVGSGSTSDIEFKAYLKAFPSLKNSERGRELMAKYADKIATRAELISDRMNLLIADNSMSMAALAEYDRSLGDILGEDFKEAAKNPPKDTLNSAERRGKTSTPSAGKTTLSPLASKYILEAQKAKGEN